MYNKGPSFLAIAATLVSIALLIFLLRVYTRTRLLHFFGIDDCFMLISVVSILTYAIPLDKADGDVQLCTIGTLGTFTSLVQLGLGQERDTIPAEDVVAMGPHLLAFSLLVVIGTSFAKISVALYLLRIIQRRCYRRFLFVAIG
jgi:hypothetical protein